MHFSERDVGDFRIYAGAIEEGTGYVASVVVHRRRLARSPEVIHRDERLFGGHRFDASQEALTRAMDIGHRAIRTRQLADAAAHAESTMAQGTPLPA